MNNAASAPVKNKARKLSLRESFDLPLVVIVFTLFAFGLLMVYSASWQFARGTGNSEYITVLKQFGFGVFGAIIALVLTFFDYHRYHRWIVPIMIITLASLLAVVLFGTETEFGAKRGLFNGSIQPSELAKLVIIIYLSFWLYSKREVLDQWTFGLIPMMLIVGVTAGLILTQPDVSAAATVIFLGVVLFFIAGGKLKQLIIVFVVTAALGFLIVQVNSNASTRLSDYWSGLQNPENASDHVKWSLEAIINGGVFGVGIGRSTTKFIGLPVAPTDSIFAVIAEETGLIGAFFVMLLYILLLWRGITIANRAKDELGKWLATGVTLWIIIEAAINMGVIVNLVPFAGNALPFISAGGSSLVTVMAGVGIIMGVSRTSKLDQTSPEGTKHSAVVDLRRRDRRGSVSSSLRSTGHRE